MQIVIDIPDFIYNALKEDVDCGTVKFLIFVTKPNLAKLIIKEKLMAVR